MNNETSAPQAELQDTVNFEQLNLSKEVRRALLQSDNYDLLCVGGGLSTGRRDLLLPLAVKLHDEQGYEILYFDDVDETKGDARFNYFHIYNIMDMTKYKGFSGSVLNYMSNIKDLGKTVVIIGEVRCNDVLNRIDMLLMAGCKVMFSIHGLDQASSLKRLSAYLSLAHNCFNKEFTLLSVYTGYKASNEITDISLISFNELVNEAQNGSLI